jgi:lipopolysaccharide transport system ATP-binding protein
MSDTIITVENLSKSYLVGLKSANQGYKRYTALRDVIGQEARNIARNAVNIVRGRQVVFGDEVEEFWALKDVSFEIKRGEVLGIIGRNGAGKSTLLKILSRITEPTKGRVILRGRVASLLEVGTGFHPELTGRENIYLNGAILGMTRTEIRRKFDEIVAFAEVEKFLDTPVKRYSSGMYVRLAFAVAAHLEPEILIVDEVLAVGDTEFQKKCLGKMRDISLGEGRTILFVSHSLPAVLNLCTTAICLDKGAVAHRGNPGVVCASYASSRATSRRFEGLSNSILKGISLLNEIDEPSSHLMQGQDLKFRLILTLPNEKCAVSLIIKDQREAILFELFDRAFSPRRTGDYHTVVDVNGGILPFLPGIYSADFWCGDRTLNRIEQIESAIEFEVAAGAIKGIVIGSANSANYAGAFYYPSNWKVREQSTAL